MTTQLEVLFAPAEFMALNQRDLSQTVCVVFDVLRATTSMVTALANGATALVPVSEIADAIDHRRKNPGVLLAGERNGLRILGAQAGGIDFDLGNSPREFVAEKIRGRTIVITTTNGTRALQACARAKTVWIGSFLNLSAVAREIQQAQTKRVLIVCSGTMEEASFEDTLGAGALCDLLWPSFGSGVVADSSHIAREIFLRHADDLLGAMKFARNGRRLLSMPELRDDVAFALRRDVYDLVALMNSQGRIRQVAEVK